MGKNILYMFGDSDNDFFGVPNILLEHFSDDKIVSFKPISIRHLKESDNVFNLVYSYNINHLELILSENNFDMIIATSLSAFYLLETFAKLRVDFKGKIVLNVPTFRKSYKKQIDLPCIEDYATEIDTILEVENDEFVQIGIVKDLVKFKNYDVVDLEHADTDGLLQHLIDKNYI